MSVQIGQVSPDLLIDLRWRVLTPHQPRSSAHLGLDHHHASRHWALCDGEEIVAGLSVLPIRGLALRAMVVEPSQQRRGHGRRLLAHACAEVAAPIWCNARLGAVPFYVANGWIAVGPVFALEADGPHQRMVWEPVTPRPEASHATKSSVPVTAGGSGGVSHASPPPRGPNGR